MCPGIFARRSNKHVGHVACCVDCVDSQPLGAFGYQVARHNDPFQKWRDSSLAENSAADVTIRLVSPCAPKLVYFLTKQSEFLYKEKMFNGGLFMLCIGMTVKAVG